MSLYLSRRSAVTLVAALLGPWAVAVLLLLALGLFSLFNDAGTASSNILGARVTLGKPGPWGDLRYTRIAIEPPDHFVKLPQSAQPPRWFFKGFNRERLTAFIQSVPLTDDQRVTLALKSTWTEAKDGVWLSSSVELVLALSQDARAQIYNVLAPIAENQMTAKVHVFERDYINEQTEGSGLALGSVELFHKLLYRRGTQVLFADADVALPQLPDDAERRRFLKMLARKNTLLVKLLLAPESDVERLVEYWGGGGRAKDLRPLLDALSKVAGGAELGIAQLLPPFARRCIYTYPEPDAGATSARKNDLWTVLNFFARTPDKRYADAAAAAETIRKEYYEIAGENRPGDMVALFTPEDQMVCAAVYIADDIVFTQPSLGLGEPWLLMTINHWKNQWTPFLPPEKNLHVRFYRRK